MAVTANVRESAELELLREVLRVQQQILIALERQRRPLHLTREDRALLARLLPAIGGVFGSELFVARELCESASPALQLVTRGLNARQVGRLLRRGEGQTIDGYLIQRDGSELHAVLWRVVQVPEFPRRQNLSVPPQTPRGLS